MARPDEIWKTGPLVKSFLRDVRGGIPLAAEQIEVMLRLIERSGRTVRSFLDLGAGSGVLAAAILERHPGARGTLLDFSPPMLEEARRQLGDRQDLDLVVADFGEPGWTSSVAGQAPFDAVVSGYAIHHQPDARKRAVYREVFDLLAPGGVFVNVEHVASPSAWAESLYEEQFIDSLVEFNARRGSPRRREEIAEEFFRRLDKAANILAPVELQCEWLRELGFGDVDTYFKVFELAVFGGRRPA